MQTEQCSVLHGIHSPLTTTSFLSHSFVQRPSLRYVPSWQVEQISPSLQLSQSIAQGRHNLSDIYVLFGHSSTQIPWYK